MTHRNGPLTILGKQRAVTEVLERGVPVNLPVYEASWVLFRGETVVGAVVVE